MAKSSFLKGFGKQFGILAILFIISIVLYYLYNNYTLEGLTPKKKATVEGYREGRRGEEYNAGREWATL